MGQSARRASRYAFWNPASLASAGAHGPIPEAALWRIGSAQTRRLYDEAVARNDQALLCQAAEMGYPPAMVALGELYMDAHREQDDSLYYLEATSRRLNRRESGSGEAKSSVG